MTKRRGRGAGGAIKPDGSPVSAWPSERLREIDGLRGIAIVLVVLSHGWLLWPMDEVDDNRVVETLFVSGNAAVSIFFVVTGFVAAMAMLRDREVGKRALTSRLVRRWARISSHVYALLAALLVWSLLVMPDDYREYDTTASFVRVATSTWNWYLISDADVARPDLGHLWYLSVDLQALIVLAVTIWFLGHRRVWLFFGLTVTGTLAVVWRAHEYDVEGVYQALLMTTTRMDSVLWGAAAGVAVVWLRPWAHQLRWAGAAAAMLLLPTLVWAADVEVYAGWGGFAIDVLAATLVLTCALCPGLPLVSPALSVRPLQWLGMASLGLFVWHYPIFWTIAQQDLDWSWQLKTAVALGVTVAAATLTQIRLERPVQSWLADRGSAKAGVSNSAV